MKESFRRFLMNRRSPAGIRLLLAVPLLVLILFCRKRIVGDLHSLVVFVLSWAQVHGHPILARTIHIAKDITPDALIILMTLAGLGYLMPDAVKKIEESKPLRVALAVVFLVFAALTIVLNEVDRIEKEGQQQEFSGTLKTVASQNAEILQDVVANKDMPEVERRKHILGLLRNEYVLSHPSVFAGILSGDEPLPADWTNQRLRELGQSWTVSAETKVPASPIQRSYVAFDGAPIFIGSTSQTEGGDFKAGDELAFNMHFKATGPNSIQLVNLAFETFLEPNSSSDTQRKVIEEFMSRLKKEVEEQKQAPRPQTMMPGDRPFNTAFAYASIDSREPRILTQQDLDDLHAGRSIAFVIAQITYKDAGQTHHLRKFSIVQPPATPSAIWHFCASFNESD